MTHTNTEGLSDERDRLIHILVVHFDMFRAHAEEAADLFLHDKILSRRAANNSAGGVEVSALAAGQRASMESNGCGLMYMGLRHFCDHPHLPDEMRSATCACKIDAKAAIEAYLTHPSSSVSAEVTEEMVKRAAWALCNRDGYDPGSLEPGDVPCIDGRTLDGGPGHFRWRNYDAPARAALLAALNGGRENG